jgi:hypothetical protein
MTQPRSAMSVRSVTRELVMMEEEVELESTMPGQAKARGGK